MILGCKKKGGGGGCEKYNGRFAKGCQETTKTDSETGCIARLLSAVHSKSNTLMISIVVVATLKSKGGVTVA
jgi:hypothetical protein